MAAEYAHGFDRLSSAIVTVTYHGQVAQDAIQCALLDLRPVTFLGVGTRQSRILNESDQDVQNAPCIAHFAVGQPRRIVTQLLASMIGPYTSLWDALLKIEAFCLVVGIQPDQIALSAHAGGDVHGGVARSTSVA